jgi:1-acyl-sn-glycerol-3-phosphate acyltransferase
MLRKVLKTAWLWYARWVCRVLCILFFRLRTYGLRNVPTKGPFILISNHQSFLDPLFCGTPVKKHLHYLARDTLFTNWFFGWILSSVNTIPVRQGQADLSAIRKAIAKLKEGCSLCLFPEGTRTSDGKIATFKPGLGILCRRGRPAVVPVLIDGAFECWPRHKKIFSPGSIISVYYGKTITPEQVEKMDDRQLADNLTQTLRRMQNNYRLKHGKKPYDY